MLSATQVEEAGLGSDPQRPVPVHEDHGRWRATRVLPILVQCRPHVPLEYSKGGRGPHLRPDRPVLADRETHNRSPAKARALSVVGISTSFQEADADAAISEPQPPVGGGRDSRQLSSGKWIARRRLIAIERLSVKPVQAVVRRQPQEACLLYTSLAPSLHEGESFLVREARGFS